PSRRRGGGGGISGIERSLAGSRRKALRNLSERPTPCHKPPHTNVPRSHDFEPPRLGPWPGQPDLGRPDARLRSGPVLPARPARRRRLTRAALLFGRISPRPAPAIPAQRGPERSPHPAPLRASAG